MHDIQSTYGGRNINEPQLREVFRKWLPVPSASCNARFDQFFPQWFDTSFPTGGANTVNKPKITGPGLNGTGLRLRGGLAGGARRQERLVHRARLRHVAGLRRPAVHEGRLRRRRGRRGRGHPLLLGDDDHGPDLLVRRGLRDREARLAEAGRSRTPGTRGRTPSTRRSRSTARRPTRHRGRESRPTRAPTSQRAGLHARARQPHAVARRPRTSRATSAPARRRSPSASRSRRWRVSSRSSAPTPT